MTVKELTGISLTALWKEHQSSFKDFWQVSDEGNEEDLNRGGRAVAVYKLLRI